MYIKKQNITYASTGLDFNPNRNLLGHMTSLFITPADFEMPESDLQDLDTMFDYILDSKIFPIHRIFNYELQHKESVYTESAQNFSYRSYKGKDRFKIKYDIRLDYHQLLKQFEGQNLRLIIGMNNDSFLCTKNGSNVRGFLLSDFTVEDLEVFSTNLAPLRIELGEKSERNHDTYVTAGYQLEDIDRRIATIDVKVTSESILVNPDVIMEVTFQGDPVLNLTASDIVFTDEVNGELPPDVVDYMDGVYKLGAFGAELTRGCVTINAYGYIGRQKYKLEITVPYDNWNLMSGDNFVTMGGDNLIFVNTN